MERREFITGTLFGAAALAAASGPMGSSRHRKSGRPEAEQAGADLERWLLSTAKPL